MPKREKARGMEAVVRKAEAGPPATPPARRKAAMKRKGPGIAIMIAVGKPKAGDSSAPAKEVIESKAPAKGNGGRLAELEAKIRELEAKLAMFEGDESEDESEDEEMEAS